MILPDFFRGDAWTDARTAAEPDAKAPFIRRVSEPAALLADLTTRVLPYLKARGAKRVGLAGFCFGGYVALLASGTGLLCCAAGAHASVKCFNLHGSSEAEGCGQALCPQMMLQAGNDPENTKPGGEVELALAGKAFALENVFAE